MRLLFNFSFSPISLDGKTDSGIVALRCGDIPYTVGNYRAAGGGFAGRSYVFPQGHGTPSDESPVLTASTREEMESLLIAEAVPRILKYHRDSVLRSGGEFCRMARDAGEMGRFRVMEQAKLSKVSEK